MNTYPVFYLDDEKTAQALDLKVLCDLEAFLKHAVHERLPGVIIASRGERTFSSGGNLKSFRQLTSKREGLALNQKMAKLLKKLTQKPVLIVMAVEGDVIGGGCEFILSGDFIIASKGSRFAFRQVQQALTLGWGGEKNLLRRVKPSTALDWLTSGRLISGSEALASGLIDEETQNGEALARAQAFIGERRNLNPELILGFKEIVAGKPQAGAKAFARQWWSPGHRAALDKTLKKR